MCLDYFTLVVGRACGYFVSVKNNSWGFVSSTPNI